MSQPSVDRAKEAAAVASAVDSVWDSLDTVPEFNGKAAFMDKIIRAKHRADALAANLGDDGPDSRSEE